MNNEKFVNQVEEKCIPYEVLNTIPYLLFSFPKGKLLADREPIEFLCHGYSNTYFILGNCKTKLDVDCKVLEWVSRAAYKATPYQQDRLNKKFHKEMLDGINTYLGTDFNNDDICTIYTYLGNSCDHEKTVAFVQSGFDMSLLDRNLSKQVEIEDFER